MLSAQSRKAPAASSVQTYAQLLHALREAKNSSTKRIEQSIDREKVTKAWETGRLICEHILLNQDRAKYGEKVIARLAVDLEMGKRELQYRVEFAKAYPIVRPAAQLSWSHYQELLGVNDSMEREVVEK